MSPARESCLPLWSRGPMRVRVAVLADAANVADPGKLNVMGIFDTVYCRSFPAVFPLMHLVLRLEVDFDDAGKPHELAVALRDEDLKEYSRAVTPLRLPSIPAGGSAAAHQIMGFAGMTFTKPGTYHFHILWN